MGDYTDADVGTLRIRTLPNMWNHASCDHAVTTRLLPAGMQRTAVRVTWLVDQDAVEGPRLPAGRHHALLATHLRAGLGACASRPRRASTRRTTCRGRFRRYKEYNVDAFVRWCLQQLAVE